MLPSNRSLVSLEQQSTSKVKVKTSDASTGNEKNMVKDISSVVSRRRVIYHPSPLPRNRPIIQGNPGLIPSESLPEGRPILVSDRKVTSHDHLPLHRPIFESDLMIVAMHGNRPVIRLVAFQHQQEHRPIVAEP